MNAYSMTSQWHLEIAAARDAATLYSLASRFLAELPPDVRAALAPAGGSTEIADRADLERWLDALTILYCENRGAVSMAHRLMLTFLCALNERLDRIQDAPRGDEGRPDR